MGITLYFMGKVSVVLGSYAANKVDGNNFYYLLNLKNK
jgi:hypothetical protein